MRWPSGRVMTQDWGLRVQALPEALRCVLEQDALSSAWSTQEDQSGGGGGGGSTSVKRFLFSIC